MATAKKTASKSTAVAIWEQEMAGAAAKAAKAEKVIGLTKKISTRNGILSVDDEPVEDNELRVVVIGAVYENQYYDAPFNPQNPTVPVCYAFSEPDSEDPEEGMAPHPECESPEGTDEPGEGSHSGSCASCWANVMGSADVGRGKACKNIRRLAVITEDALESAEAMKEAEVRMLNVPVMSVKHWAKFVNGVSEDMQRPYWGVICLIKVVPDPKSQFVITFKFEELINFDSDLYQAMKAKQVEVNKQLVAPYPKQADLDASSAATAKPMRPQGRAAQAMAKGAAKAAAAKKAPAKTGSKKF